MPGPNIRGEAALPNMTVAVMFGVSDSSAVVDMTAKVMGRRARHTASQAARS